MNDKMMDKAWSEVYGLEQDGTTVSLHCHDGNHENCFWTGKSIDAYPERSHKRCRCNCHSSVIATPVTLCEFPKLSGYAVVPADAKLLILSFPVFINGLEVELDSEETAKMVREALDDAGLSHVTFMLFKGLEKVEILK